MGDDQLSLALSAQLAFNFSLESLRLRYGTFDQSVSVFDHH